MASVAFLILGLIVLLKSGSYTLRPSSSAARRVTPFTVPNPLMFSKVFKVIFFKSLMFLQDDSISSARVFTDEPTVPVLSSIASNSVSDRACAP